MLKIEETANVGIGTYPLYPLGIKVEDISLIFYPRYNEEDSLVIGDYVLNKERTMVRFWQFFQLILSSLKLEEFEQYMVDNKISFTTPDGKVIGYKEEEEL